MYPGYLLIHDMVHLYPSTDSLGAGTNPLEAYLIDDCVRFITYDFYKIHQITRALRLVIDVLPSFTVSDASLDSFISVKQQGCTQASDPTKPLFGLMPYNTTHTMAFISLIASADLDTSSSAASEVLRTSQLLRCNLNALSDMTSNHRRVSY